LYELAGDGTVLYSRTRMGSYLKEPTRETVGQDFFHDIARFQNINDLRNHFRKFITGGRPADTFLFDCRYETGVVRTKIFMTRAYETDNDHSGGIVIMDIRQIGS
jgi:hypothetical protein